MFQIIVCYLQYIILNAEIVPYSMYHIKMPYFSKYMKSLTYRFSIPQYTHKNSFKMFKPFP